MGHRAQRAFIAFMVALAALAVVWLSLLLFASPATQSTVQRLHWEGEVSDEAGWRALSADERFLFQPQETYRLRGRMDATVRAGDYLVFPVDGFSLTLWRNGRQLWAQETDPEQFGIRQWVSIPLPNGLSPSDELEFVIQSVAPFPISCRQLLANLYAGPEQAVWHDLAQHWSWTLALGAFACVIGTVLIVITCFAQTHMFNVSRLALCAFLVVSGIWLMLDARYVTLLIQRPVFLQGLSWFCLTLMTLLFARYLLKALHGKRKAWGKGLLWTLCALALCCLVLRLAHILSAAVAEQIQYAAVLVCALTYTVLLLLERIRPIPHQRTEPVWPFRFLLLGVYAEFVNLWCGLFAPRTLFACAYLVYLVSQIALLLRSLRESLEKTRQYGQMEAELAESRISVMLSQIKPHFLFNALNSISALCLSDPLMADQAITSLSRYLRGNLSALEQKTPIPFTQELEQIKYYVRLEKLRFDDKLQVVYSIDFEDFSVPTLALQTLMENAVRHGLGPKKEGGVVVLHTERQGNLAVVEIVDNGVGFPTEPTAPRDRPAIGIQNTRDRLQHLVHGSLEIHSESGKGTTVTIRIPLTEEADV